MQQKTKSIRYLFTKILAFLLIGCLLYSCANIVAPEGGIKDIIPPEIVKSDPPNFATSFSGKEIRIQFDEFIQLKDISKNLLISPPFDNPPDCRIKGRSLIIRFEDSLLKNTTYNLFFGDAIADLNEGNPLKGYRFVFSTGAALDSMQISGTVRDALTLESQKEVNILLYDKFEDSIPFKEKPKYVCRSQANGNFIFENLGKGPYKMLALKEKNNNFMFDDKSEEIGFIDSLVVTDPMPAKCIDSIHNDSIPKIITDTAKLSIYLFKEKENIIRIIKRQLIKSRHISLVFSDKTTNISFAPIDTKPLPPGTRLLHELNTGKDSLSLWVTGDSIPDSLSLKVSVNNRPPDTIAFDLRKFDKSSRVRKQDVKNKISFTANANSNFNLNDSIRISFSYPLLNIVSDSIRLLADTVLVKPVISTDSVKRLVYIKTQWKENTKYHLYIPPSSLTDLTGHTNDSISLTLFTKQLKDYGTLTIHYEPELKGNYILQLINDRNKVEKEFCFKEKSTIDWTYLSTGKYKLRLVFDNNNNGVWDTGNYLKKQLPEKVRYFPREIEIRANWELEEIWKF